MARIISAGGEDAKLSHGERVLIVAAAVTDKSFFAAHWDATCDDSGGGRGWDW
jgi:hypothetical protein